MPRTFALVEIRGKLTELVARAANVSVTDVRDDTKLVIDLGIGDDEILDLLMQTEKHFGFTIQLYRLPNRAQIPHWSFDDIRRLCEEAASVPAN